MIILFMRMRTQLLVILLQPNNSKYNFDSGKSTNVNYRTKFVLVHRRHIFSFIKCISRRWVITFADIIVSIVINEFEHNSILVGLENSILNCYTKSISISKARCRSNNTDCCVHTTEQQRWHFTSNLLFGCFSRRLFLFLLIMFR